MPPPIAQRSPTELLPCFQAVLTRFTRPSTWNSPEEITNTGLLISECPPGFKARSQDFPRRNRIISGCSLGVVIVEAAERSGSLITARLAAEQNREVFAVPAHPLEARASGTNGLIKDGAIFTTSAKDVINALQPALRQWPELAAQGGVASKWSEPERASQPLFETGRIRGRTQFSWGNYKGCVESIERRAS